MSRAKSKLEKLEEAFVMKNHELTLVNEICESKASDKSGVWQRMLSSRQDTSKNLLMQLDPTDDELAIKYARLREVIDEYQLLLSLLRDPDKRRAKVLIEIEEIKKLVSSEKDGAKPSQY